MKFTAGVGCSLHSVRSASSRTQSPCVPTAHSPATAARRTGLAHPAQPPFRSPAPGPAPWELMWSRAPQGRGLTRPLPTSPAGRPAGAHACARSSLTPAARGSPSAMIVGSLCIFTGLWPSPHQATNLRGQELGRVPRKAPWAGLQAPADTHGAVPGNTAPADLASASALPVPFVTPGTDRRACPSVLRWLHPPRFSQHRLSQVTETFSSMLGPKAFSTRVWLGRSL